MRWFSHRARTWKNTVLKIKIKKKTKGFTLVATALAVLCWIFIAQAFFMMSSGTLSTVKAERTAYQAEQNTALDVSRLKALDYDDLDSKGAHARKVIEGVGDGNWESEVTIDPEQPLNGGDDDAKLRIAHVKVYRTGDTTSRYSLDVPLTSQNGSNLRDVELTIPVDEKISHDEEHRALITHFTMPKFLGSGMHTSSATYTVTMPSDGYIEVDNISATNDLTGMTCKTNPCAFFPSIGYDEEYHLAGEQLTLTNSSASVQFMGHGIEGAGDEMLPVGVEGDVYVVPRIVKPAHNLHVEVPVDEIINLLAEQHKAEIIEKYDE